MRLPTRLQDALSSTATSWWKGADPGRQVEVSITLRVPTHRTDEEVLSFFAGIAEHLNGGYNTRTEVKP